MSSVLRFPQMLQRARWLGSALLGAACTAAIFVACGFDGAGERASAADLDGSATSDSSSGGDSQVGPSDGGVIFVEGGDGSATCAADLATDPMNCGRCGRSCGGGSCTAGQCPVITLATVERPYEVTLDTNDVYWTAKGGTAPPNVSHCPKVGGPVVAVATLTMNADPTSLVLASGRLVFTDGNGNQVDSCALPGPGCLGLLGESQPHGIAWNGTLLFWANSASGAVRRVDPTALTISSFVLNESGIDRIAADAAYVFWTVSSGVHGRAIAAPAVAIEFATPAAPRDLAIDGTYVYVATPTEIVRVTYAAANLLVVATGIDIQRIAVDSSGIYFTDRGGGTGRILRCPIAGCVAPQQPEGIATAEDMPFGIALGPVNVFWANEATVGTAGAIRRVVK